MTNKQYDYTTPLTEEELKFFKMGCDAREHDIALNECCLEHPNEIILWQLGWHAQDDQIEQFYKDQYIEELRNHERYLEELREETHGW